MSTFSKVNTNDSDDDIDYNAIQQRAQRLLSDSSILSPVEHQIKDREKRKNSMNPADTKLLFELLDSDQQPPLKMKYDENLNDGWAYHPTLGDLEKREITIREKREKSEIRRKEILWFAKEDNLSTRKVFISIKVRRVSSIDNVLETFRMRFIINLNWIMTEREYWRYTKDKASKYYFEPLWKPDLEFMNAVELHSMRWFEFPEFGKYLAIFMFATSTMLLNQMSLILHCADSFAVSSNAM